MVFIRPCLAGYARLGLTTVRTRSIGQIAARDKARAIAFPGTFYQTSQRRHKLIGLTARASPKMTGGWEDLPDQNRDTDVK